jgi:hypothetical protein
VIFKGMSYDLLIWNIFFDLTKICYELGTVLFNFSFEETFLASLFLFLFAMIYGLKSNNEGRQKNQDNKDSVHWVVVVFILLIVLNGLISHEILRVRYAAFIMLLLLIIAFFKNRSMHILNLDIVKNRMIVSIIGAILILLWVSPLFWRDLKNQRFVLILFPFLLFFVYQVFSQKVVRTISVILAISGLIYISSTRVSNGYPPPSYGKDIPVIFQNEFAYSNQYFKQRKDVPNDPYLIDKTKFEKFCKICKMGKKNIDFAKYNEIWIVGSYDFDPAPFLPSDHKLVSKIEHLTWLDRLQFQFMTPLHHARHRHTTSIYRRTEISQSE